MPPVRETRHLWVGNIPESTTEEKLIEYFQRYILLALFLLDFVFSQVNMQLQNQKEQGAMLRVIMK